MATRERSEAIKGKRVRDMGFIMSENIFEDEKIKLIESLPSGDETLVIFFKMVAIACKSNAGGFLVMDRRIPYTDEMLSVVWGRSLPRVRHAIKTLMEFGLIVESEEGFGVKHLHEWMLEREEEAKRLEMAERVEKHREQKQLEAPSEDDKKKKEKRVYNENDVEMNLSMLLFQRMRDNNPEAKEPNFQVWANHIRLMIERDNRKPEQIKNMIEWCQQDSFWKTNILSTKKLREKYDQLKVRAIEEYERNKRNGMNRREQNVDDIFNRLMGGEQNDVSRRLDRP